MTRKEFIFINTGEKIIADIVIMGTDTAKAFGVFKTGIIARDIKTQARANSVIFDTSSATPSPSPAK